MRALPILVLLAIPSLAYAATDRVAVFCLEEDAASAGGRQLRLEERLRSAKEIQLRPSTDVASRLLRGATPQRPDQTKIVELLESAKDPYFGNDLAVAEGRVAEAEAALDAMGSMPAFDRAEILLWRTALLLAKSDDAGAEAQARRLLALAPEAKADLDTFRPSVARLLDGIRASLPLPVTVRLRGLPKSARVWIDGRPAGEAWRVAPGRHRLLVEAPGFRSTELDFDAQSDVVLPVGLAVSVAPGLERQLLSFASGAALDEKERSQVWEVLFRANADTLVVITRVEGGLRARAFSRGKSMPPSAVVPATSEGEKSIAEWIVATLSPPGAASPAAATASGAWTIRGGLALAMRDWELTGAGGGRLGTGFTGGGPRVTASLEAGALLGEASFEYATYGLRQESIALADGSHVDVGGGTTLGAGFHGGYRLSIGRSDIRPAIAFLGGVGFERHDADPLVDSAGDLGLLPSWDRVAVDLGVRSEVPVPLRPQAVVSLDATLSPWSSWRTEPDDALGSSPDPGIAFAWSAAADIGVGSRWALRLAYEGRHRSVRFEGTSAAPVDPPLRDARATERTHAVLLTFGRGF